MIRDRNYRYRPASRYLFDSEMISHREAVVNRIFYLLHPLTGTCNGGQTPVPVQELSKQMRAENVLPQWFSEFIFRYLPLFLLYFLLFPGVRQVRQNPAILKVQRGTCNGGQTRVSTLSQLEVQRGTDPGFHPVPAGGATGDRPPIPARMIMIRAGSKIKKKFMKETKFVVDSVVKWW